LRLSGACSRQFVTPPQAKPEIALKPDAAPGQSYRISGQIAATAARASLEVPRTLTNSMARSAGSTGTRKVEQTHKKSPIETDFA